jgi:hypothetical protein
MDFTVTIPDDLLAELEEFMADKTAVEDKDTKRSRIHHLLVGSINRTITDLRKATAIASVADKTKDDIKLITIQEKKP